MAAQDSAAIYVRVSSDEQAADGKTSLAEQEATCRKYAELKGLQVAEVFIDDGVSGAKAMADRDAGKALLDAASLGRFSRVIVAKLDRLTRSVRHGAADLAQLEEYGVSVAFIDIGGGDTIDTGTGTGKLMLQMLMAFAEFERERIAERMSGARLAKAKAGKWPGGVLPFGYRTVEGRIVADATQAQTVRRIFTLVADGIGAKAVAALLDRDGVASPGTSKAWAYQTVITMIGHEAYRTGKVTREQNGRPFTFEAPKLIDGGLWKAANAVLKQRTKEAQAKRRTVTRRYALSGHLQHLHPDATAMSGRYRSNTKLGRMYQCSDVATCPGLGQDHAGQRLTSLPSAQIEAGMLLWGLALLDDPERLAEWVHSHDRDVMGGDDSAAVAARAAKQLAEVQEQLDNLEGNAHKIKPATYDAKQGELLSKAADLQAVIDRHSQGEQQATALRLGINALKGADTAARLTDILSADIDRTLPGPADIDASQPSEWVAIGPEGDEWQVPEPGSWDWLKEQLRAEAREVLAALEAQTNGRPKKGAPAVRDLAPWAQEWAQALVQRFKLSITVESREASTWQVLGAVPQRVSGPGTKGPGCTCLRSHSVPH